MVKIGKSAEGPAGPMRNEEFVRQVSNAFKRNNPEVARAVEDSKGDGFKTRIHIVVGYPTGEVWLGLRDKDAPPKEINLVTKDEGAMVGICDLLRAGMTFRQLRDEGVFKPGPGGDEEKGGDS